MTAPGVREEPEPATGTGTDTDAGDSAPDGAAADAAAVPPRVLRQRVFRRLVHHAPALAGMVIAALFVLVGVLAPVISPYDPVATDFGTGLQPPSLAHPLGTDELGRDQLSRTFHGARASMQVGVLATLLAMVAAVPFGLVAGYYRGRLGSVLDAVIGRLVDVMLSFPFLVLAVGLAVILGPSLATAAVAIGVVELPQVIRIMRGETLALREREFVEAAVANGAPDWVIMVRHILPNAMSALIVRATVIIPIAINGEALLSFLGFGVQPPTPSLGVMLSAAQPYLTQAPWLAVFPGIAIALASLSFNLFGDGLRDALDPRRQELLSR